MRKNKVTTQNQDFCKFENCEIQMVIARKRVIDFYRHGNWIYQVSINDLQTGQQVLDWCRQLSQKSWMSSSLLSEFCSLAIGALRNGD
jgi:hypothetical protein